MKLHDHPKIHWPPTWSGGYDIEAGEVPILEQGMLQDVQLPGELGLSQAMFSTHLTLAVEYKGNSFGGTLIVDDPNLLEPLYHKLREHIGHPIHEIGNLEVP